MGMWLEGGFKGKWKNIIQTSIKVNQSDSRRWRSSSEGNRSVMSLLNGMEMG